MCEVFDMVGIMAISFFCLVFTVFSNLAVYTVCSRLGVVAVAYGLDIVYVHI